jgi:hypothetical protein
MHTSFAERRTSLTRIDSSSGDMVMLLVERKNERSEKFYSKLLVCYIFRDIYGEIDVSLLGIVCPVPYIFESIQ